MSQRRGGAVWAGGGPGAPGIEATPGGLKATAGWSTPRGSPGSGSGSAIALPRAGAVTGAVAASAAFAAGAGTGLKTV
jgi:hypothetical protein